MGRGSRGSWSELHSESSGRGARHTSTHRTEADITVERPVSSPSEGTPPNGQCDACGAAVPRCMGRREKEKQPSDGQQAQPLGKAPATVHLQILKYPHTQPFRSTCVRVCIHGGILSLLHAHTHAHMWARQKREPTSDVPIKQTHASKTPLTPPLSQAKIQPHILSPSLPTSSLQSNKHRSDSHICDLTHTLQGPCRSARAGGILPISKTGKRRF